MKLSYYGLIALVIIATSAPTLALAQYENSGDDQGGTMILMIFSLTLYVTISAIISVVGYSIWKVCRIRRNTMKKLV
ncbi:MAG: hypothetical protein ACREAR_05495 [Nitrosotalea sp.]